MTFYDQDETTKTRLFIRMMDTFFDCLNVRARLEGMRSRRREKLPYTSEKDDCFKVLYIYNYRLHFILNFMHFQWLGETFLKYLHGRLESCFS